MSCGISSPKQLFRVVTNAEGTLAPYRAPDPRGGRAPFRNTFIPSSHQTGGGRYSKQLANRISVRLCYGMTHDQIFKALGDTTRRAIFEKLAVGSMNASALREGMAISQPAMSQHLAALRNAGLVREMRQGRYVNYEVDPDGLALIAQWLTKYRAYWPVRVDALRALLKDMDQ